MERSGSERGRSGARPPLERSGAERSEGVLGTKEVLGFIVDLDFKISLDFLFFDYRFPRIS